jgi:nucleotide-binding universal stress UspA family protein
MTWNPEIIIVGVDGSDGSKRAAEHATALARRGGSQLLIVTVVRTPEGWWGLGGAPPTPEALTNALIEGQQQVLGEIEAHLDLEGVNYETVQELGDPVNQILALCDDREAGLLVIGRRGAGLVERVVLGSVADRLTHLAPCPVLIVP